MSMKYQSLGMSLKLTASAISSAFKMGSRKRYPLEKLSASAQIEVSKQYIGASPEDRMILEILENCEEVLKRLEYMVDEEN